MDNAREAALIALGRLMDANKEGLGRYVDPSRTLMEAAAAFLFDWNFDFCPHDAEARRRARRHFLNLGTAGQEVLLFRVRYRVDPLAEWPEVGGTPARAGEEA